MIDRDKFDLQTIEELLGALRAKLRDHGAAAVIYVVGGAAIVLNGVLGDRRTGDVDALFVPEDAVRRAAAEVAAERGIRPDWLNSAVSAWVPRVRPPLQPPVEPGLEVRTAGDEVLLAMKIRAARGSRDLRDSLALAHRLHLWTSDQLYGLVVDVYGEDVLEATEYGGLDEIRLRCQVIADHLRRGSGD